LGAHSSRALEESKVDVGDTDLCWSIRQRLEFIEFRLFWERHVNRIDVMQQFSVSVNQAPLDLNRYIAVAPGNMLYDKSLRTYVRTSGIVCRLRELDAAHYLAQMCLISDKVLEEDSYWIPDLPPYASTPPPVRGVEHVELRSVIDAIRRTDAIEVKYQSLSHPAPRWRWIAPHAIAFDGFRWHARAFCLIDECFKDFLLSRILEIRGSRDSDN